MKFNLKKYEDQKRELEDLNDQWENSNRVLEFYKQDLEEKLYQAEETAIMYKEELGEVSSQKESELQRLRDEIKDLKQELLMVVNQHGDINKIHELELSLNKALDEMATLKKNAEPKIEYIPGTVSVYVKLRPVLETDANKNISLIAKDNLITIETSKDTSRSSIRSYPFEKVYGVMSPLSDIFEDIKPSLLHVAKGKSCCILSYGQTGSGKTYTMNGLLNRSLNYLSTIVSDDIKISFHCIEVYNEQVRDLLADTGLSRNWKNILSISFKPLDGNWVEKAKEFLSIASYKRSTKCTDVNEMSSRSHCIYTFVLDSYKNTGILQFVDLAGSERISKSGVAGDTLKESVHINRSLSALQDVISALESKASHIPYRNSLLTRLLKNSLDGNDSKVTVILNCSPTEDNLNESLSTLSLGTRLKNIDLGWAIRKNLKNEEVERTLTLLEKERSDKNALIRRLDRLEKDIEGYSNIIKEKDNKILLLNNKIKNLEKTHAEQSENIRKEVKILKIKQEQTDRKLQLIKSKAEQQKIAKSKVLSLLKAKTDETKRVMSADPYILKKSATKKSHTKTQTPSRILQPGFMSCNTSAVYIIA